MYFYYGREMVDKVLIDCLSGISTTGFVPALSWINNVTAGHSKKVTVNAIMLITYCVGNAAGPFMWQAQYKPRYANTRLYFLPTSLTFACRNHIPWLIIGICIAT